MYLSSRSSARLVQVVPNEQTHRRNITVTSAIQIGAPNTNDTIRSVKVAFLHRSTRSVSRLGDHGLRSIVPGMLVRP